MAVKVYGARYSTCTQRVLAVLHELDVQYGLEFVDMTKGEHKSPGFVQSHHPFGVIPVIEDDGVRLFESRAICRYLVEKYSQTQHESLVPLTPADAATHGLYEQALSVEYSYFDPAMKTLSYELLFKQ
ncbi:Glutathione S-transferase F10 [Pestalotiopsis sp. 9143b]|nr:Glutathione S-transferase F10 [Pestalotiopsis sp. 9143b]